MKLSNFLFACFVIFTVVAIFGYLLPRAIEREMEMSQSHIRGF